MGFTVTATHRGYRFAIERESAAALVFDRPPPRAPSGLVFDYPGGQPADTLKKESGNAQQLRKFPEHQE